MRQEANAREVCEDEEGRAEVVWRLECCWPRGGIVADCLGDRRRCGRYAWSSACHRSEKNVLILVYHAVKPRGDAHGRGGRRREAAECACRGAAVDLDERTRRLATQWRGPVAQHVENARETACTNVHSCSGGVPPRGAELRRKQGVN